MAASVGWSPHFGYRWARARGWNSHADFRIVAEGFYQDDGRCRRRHDLWPRRFCQSPGVQASGPEETDAGGRSLSGRPKGNESCGTCPYFEFPKSCVVVEGDISVNGWCPMYTPFLPADRGAHK